MLNQKRLRDYQIEIGQLKTGRLNAISDVAGIKVGHKTIQDGTIQTGVTAVLPHSGNVFKEKVMSAIYSINGFGKTTGFIQIDEMGTIETPIILTNTLSIGIGIQALVDYSLEQNPEIGRTTGTVNPVVCECNDMLINDIRNVSITKEDVLQSIHDASEEFQEGNIGAGTGMVSFGLKGGIGSSSRVLSIKDFDFTVGVLTLTNFGKMEQLLLNGKKIGPSIKQFINDTRNEVEKGSIIIIVALDIPVSERQLKRILKRATVGLAKTGSYIGNGSGDIVLGFTTANKVQHEQDEPLSNRTIIQDHYLDQVFQAVADATEEAILNSLVTSTTTIARNGQKIHSLRDFMNRLM
ncbi:P1 family peptidase [Bacillus salitolerans]|uniref:P1 family peptidase n=1 Tax=Bacillus salitolerans TaxID=1437434 RepID=A0ABW4LTE9_9BACI